MNWARAAHVGFSDESDWNKERFHSLGIVSCTLSHAWLADVPSHLPECRSPFFATDAGVMSDVWLEVRKRRMPARPPVPDAIRNWVSEDDLDNVETEPQLLAEITVPVERSKLTMRPPRKETPSHGRSPRYGA